MPKGLRTTLCSGTATEDLFSKIIVPFTLAPAGASVKGTIIFEKRSSVAVPEQSVVLRPLGTFVYESKNNKAIAKKVTTGITQEGWIEIIDGISEGTDIVIDGAGYLTNDANIKIKQNDPA